MVPAPPSGGIVTIGPAFRSEPGQAVFEICWRMQSENSARRLPTPIIPPSSESCGPDASTFKVSRNSWLLAQPADGTWRVMASANTRFDRNKFLEAVAHIPVLVSTGVWAR